MIGKFLPLAVATIGAGVVLVVACNVLVIGSSLNRLAEEPSQLAATDVALVLGASPWAPDGSPSEHFQGRMDAAAALLASGRVRHLLLSGANPAFNYNEPLRMQEALLERGVPAAVTTLDYAGRRTFDSVVRAREIFGQQQLVIVSQRYHLYRAVFIARQLGIEASGFVAPRPRLRNRYRAELRELGARVLAVLDLFLLDTRPRFLGEPEPIAIDQAGTGAG